MKRWTKDEEELLALWVQQGWLYKDIANELGRSTVAVKHRCSRLKIGNNRFRAKTIVEYKEELKTKCPDIECLGEYINAHIHILHKCLVCGVEHYATPNSRLQGTGHCGRSSNMGNGIPRDKPGITYLVYIPKYDLYKIGITSKTVKERMLDNKLSNYESILEIHFEEGKDAMLLEEEWKRNLKDYLVNTSKLCTGNTETFRI